MVNCFFKMWMNALAFHVPTMHFVSTYLALISATVKRATLERNVKKLWKVSMITIHLFFLTSFLFTFTYHMKNDRSISL